jgi:hypothetical protein
MRTLVGEGIDRVFANLSVGDEKGAAAPGTDLVGNGGKSAKELPGGGERQRPVLPGAKRRRVSLVRQWDNSRA